MFSFPAVPAGSDSLKQEKEALRSDVDKSRDNLSYIQSNRSTIKQAELHQAYDADMSLLKEKL